MPRTPKPIRKLNGYTLLYKPEHPNSMKSSSYRGYIYEHRYVAELTLGRYLTPKEIVHHIDGNRANNSPSNLKVCSGRTEHAYSHNPDGKPKEYFCIDCGKRVSTKNAQRCFDCYQLNKRKVEHPTKEELESLISELNWCELGRRFGVSDNAVRKWARKYGLL